MKQTNRKIRRAFPILILACALWLTACVEPTAQTTAGDEGATAAAMRTRLVIGVPNITDILDAQQAYGGGPATTEQIGQALVRLDPATGDLIPDLAESWSFSEDNLTLTITLPEGALYSNGDPLDAKAVAAALLRNKEVSPYASDFEGLADVQAVDVSTVELSFFEPPAAFLTVLNSSFGGPWNAAAAETMGNEAFATAPVASGPLMIQEFTPGAELLLVRNPNYQTSLPLVENKGPLHLEEVLVRVIPEELTLVGELETGAIDVVADVPASAIERLQANPEINVMEARQPGSFGLVMNLERPIFADLRVRQAIAKAVDRESLVKVISGATPAYTFVTPGMIAYDAEVDSYAQELHAHDVAAAQALLADAGWADSDGDGIVEKDGEPLAFEFLIPTDATEQAQAAQVLQSQLQAVGIDLQINQQEINATWETKSAGDFDMGIENYGWADPDILSVVLGAPFWNHANFDNPTVLDAMTTARYIMDPTERTAAYADIQRQLLDEVIEIPLWQGTYYVAARTNVEGLVFPGSFQLFLNDVTVTE
ncbi:MAG: ABC transporter substrate-binding protein [Caldilineaceae bacterium]